MAEEKHKVGDRFGKWTLEMKLASDRRCGSRWLLRCDCGVKKILFANNVRSGKSKGCPSCAAKERWAKKKGV